MIKVTVGNNVSRKSVMVSADATLRSILEENEIDYTRGMTSLDGATLKPGDLDKSFADLGVAEKCYLLNVVKADNAATAVANGEACVLKSAMKLDDIKLAKKYDKSALVLTEKVDGAKEEIFRVDIAAKGPGSASMYGVEFAPNADKDGYAQVTVMMPANHGDVSDWIEDNMGAAIKHLSTLEANFAAALENIAADRKTVRDAITVL